MLEALNLRQTRRLALCCAGLLRPRWFGLPTRAAGRRSRARRAAEAIIRHFGYLQLDTVAVAGVRSHSLVLMARLAGIDPRLAEELLQPGRPLFEYWGHEASWMPIELYPLFGWRRRRFRRHPWWGEVLRQNPRLVERILRQVEEHGPLRSADLEGSGTSGWWSFKLAKKVANALWSSGELAIRERRNFQRYYDQPAKVIPADVLQREVTEAEALKELLLLALRGHGWAPTSTLAATWRLRNLRAEINAALEELVDEGRVARCELRLADRALKGWIRPEHRERAEQLGRITLRADRALPLSPFDPLLWDRDRVELLFGFHQVLEIFKPAAERRYGYYCLPLLVGERLVARCDLKAHRTGGRLEVVQLHFEDGKRCSDREHVATALRLYADRLELTLDRAPTAGA